MSWSSLIQLGHISTVGSCCTCYTCVHHGCRGVGLAPGAPAWSPGPESVWMAAGPLFTQPLSRCIHSEVVSLCTKGPRSPFLWPSWLGLSGHPRVQLPPLAVK